MTIEGFVQEGRYYVPLEGFTSQPASTSQANTISLTNSQNVFALQNAVSDHLNDFQTNYARYVKCSDPSTSGNVNPACGNDDTFQTVTISYYELMDAIHKLNDSYQNQALTNDSNQNEYLSQIAEVQQKYEEMRKMREEMEKTLAKLQYDMKNGPESPKQMLDTTIFGYVLWVILATCLIYFIFIY